MVEAVELTVDAEVAIEEDDAAVAARGGVGPDPLIVSRTYFRGLQTERN
jgi:hypothetical protein